MSRSRFLVSVVGYTPERADSVADAICLRWGLRPRDILGYSKRPQHFWPRAQLCWELHCRHGWSKSAVARLLGRDPSTILHAIRRFETRRREQGALPVFHLADGPGR